jgi:hypothetical protein
LIKLFDVFKRKFFVAIAGALLLFVAFPMVARATAIVSFSVDNTTITLGQRVTFSVRTTPGTNFVFAEVGNSRVAGTRLSTDAAGIQTWQVVVTPTQSANIVVYANSTNTITGAATVTVPITVEGTVGNMTQPGLTGSGVAGGLSILSITETPATQRDHVQLTVVTGAQVNYVWVRFDTPGRYRFTNVPIAQDATTRTWRVEFRPNHWTPQTVQVSANRAYENTGATHVNHTLTLTHPFVTGGNPAIQTVSHTPTNVAANANVTMTIRTNADVEHVWVVDANGREHTAIRSHPTTIAARTWEVTFRPERTGSVQVFANRTRSTVGAALRNHNLTIQGQRVSILEARSHWSNWGTNEAQITVVTNNFAQDVWVRLPDGRDISLNRQGTGSGNRTWVATITNVTFPVQVRASESSTGRAIDAQHTLNSIGDDHHIDTTSRIINVGQPSHFNRRPGDTVTFRIETSADISSLIILGTHGSSEWLTNNIHSTLTPHNTRVWYVEVRLNHTIPQDQVTASFTVEGIGNFGNPTTTTQSITITR